MINPDYRALCAELVASWDKDYPWDHVDGPKRISALLDRARAALAQPEPEPPTDDGVATLIPWLVEAAIHAADKGNGLAAGRLELAAHLLGERWGAGQ